MASTLNFNYFLLPTEYPPAEFLMPRPQSKKCPKSTQYKEGEKRDEKAGEKLDDTCSCGEHCAWDLCRLATPPDKCLQGTNSNWQWDKFKNAWVAQVIQGNHFYSKQI